MSNVRKLAGWICLWATMTTITAGFSNAHLRAETPELHQSARQAAQSLAFSIGWSLFPPAWFVWPFVTGYGRDGWTLTSAPTPCTEITAIGWAVWCGR